MKNAFIARILWSYYFDSTDANAKFDFRDFLECAGQLLDHVSFDDVIAHVRSDYCNRTKNSDLKILLLVDEFAKSKVLFPEDVNNKNKQMQPDSSFSSDQVQFGALFLSNICSRFLDSQKNKLIISSLDPFVLSHVGVTSSGRRVYWISLKPLSDNLAKEALVQGGFKVLEPTLTRCIRSANGLPRFLEHYITTFIDFSKSSSCFHSKFIELISKASSKANVPREQASEIVIAAGFLGELISLQTPIGKLSLSELISRAVYVYSFDGTSSSCVPRLSGFLLYHVVHETPNTTTFWKCLKALCSCLIEQDMFGPSFDGAKFELFHFNFECLKQLSRQLCQDLEIEGPKWKLLRQQIKSSNITVYLSYINCSISDHYHLVTPSINEPCK